MSESKHLSVTCPDCGIELKVDARTGLVLNRKAKKSSYSLEEALEQERNRKDKADDVFAKAFQNEKERHDSLEEKFRQALDSKDELEDPKRPFDFD